MEKISDTQIRIITPQSDKIEDLDIIQVANEIETLKDKIAYYQKLLIDKEKIIIDAKLLGVEPRKDIVELN